MSLTEPPQTLPPAERGDRPAPAAANPEGPPGRSAGGRGHRGAADRPLAPPRPSDRASASDPGPIRPSLERASRGAGGRDEAGADRGLRGRDLLRPFRRGEGRRDAAAAGDGARLRFAVLRHGGRRASAWRIAETLGPDVRVVRAPCMGACDRAPVCAVGHVQVMQATRRASPLRQSSRMRTPMPSLEPGTDFDAYVAAAAIASAQGLPRRQAHARRHDQDRQRCRPARPRRRRLSDRAQMVAGARRARAAPDGGQCRRRRARHVQGPLLSRARSAPLPRRHADRRLGGRGRRDLHLYPRRISRIAADARRRDRQSSKPPGSIASARFICAAAPALISAAKNRR